MMSRIKMTTLQNVEGNSENSEFIQKRSSTADRSPKDRAPKAREPEKERREKDDKPKEDASPKEPKEKQSRKEAAHRISEETEEGTTFFCPSSVSIISNLLYYTTSNTIIKYISIYWVYIYFLEWSSSSSFRSQPEPRAGRGRRRQK